MNSQPTRAARDLLSFYLEAGVDAVIGEEPIDRFSDASQPAADAQGSRRAPEVARPTAAAERPPPAEPRSPPTPPKTLALNGGSVSAPPPSPDAAIMAAREIARRASNLAELRNILEEFEGCALRNTATQLVFADGNPEARVMFIGEAPGREEDIEGLPFVGRSGKLLDRMLATIGLDRTSAYIANIVPWRPPGNRTPTPQETAICLPFIERQIELANPDILVCVGVPSTQAILRVKEGIRKLRGRWFPYTTGTRDIRAMPIYHPAYLLRSPLEKRWAWRDLLAIRAALDDR